MKKTFLLAGALFAILFSSCEDNFPQRITNPDAATPPTAAEFTAMRTAAYNNLKQEFTADASQPSIGFTSEKRCRSYYLQQLFDQERSSSNRRDRH